MLRPNDESAQLNVKALYVTDAAVLANEMNALLRNSPV